MVSTIPQRLISSTVERIGASKKKMETKKHIGHSVSDRIMSQKTFL